MPRITREEAARVAALAKLDLTPAEIDHAARELESILDYFDVIARVDTAGIALDPGAAAAAPLRPDDPRPPLTRAEAFANAPDADAEAGLFRVPRVLGS